MKSVRKQETGATIAYRTQKGRRTIRETIIITTNASFLTRLLTYRFKLVFFIYAKIFIYASHS